MKYIITIILALVIAQSDAQLADSVSAKLLHNEVLFWQAQNDSVRFYALLNKANIDKTAEAYEKALDELYRASKYATTNNELSELNYQKMLNYFLSSQYSFSSEMTLDSLGVGNHYHEYLTMKLYSMIEMEKWDRCKSELLRLCNRNDSVKANEITHLPISYKYKDPEKSRRMSAILPGLGEIYAGYTFKGITSFIINGGFLAFMGYNIYTHYYITSVVSGFYPFTKFHSGGKRLSAILADKHNTVEAGKLKNKYREEMYSLIH